jgi:hypothetical protein
MPSSAFNPEGRGYDYRSARRYGLRAAGLNRHWPSRVPGGPQRGMILKGRKHKTWEHTVAGEEAKGYKINRYRGRYYSFKRPGGV